jgi:hypothetical protein
MTSACSYFLVNNLLAVLICFYISRILFYRSGITKQFLAAAVFFPILILLDIQILGILEILDPLWISVSLLMVLLGVLICGRRLWKSFFSDPESIETRGSFQILFFLFAALIAGLVFSSCFARGTQFGPDGLSYHSFFAAHSKISKSISLPYSSGNDFFPYNAETLSIWFLLPFPGDGFVCLAGYAWGFLVFMLAFVHARRLQASLFGALLSGMIILLTPPVQQIIRSYAAVDLAGPCMLLASVYFLFPGPDRSIPSGRWNDFLAGGLCAGYSLGTKVSFLPAVVILLVLILIVYRRIGISALFSSSLVFLGGVLLTGTFWYFRNLVLTGNPFFPAEIGPFSGPLSKEIQLQTTVFHWLFLVPFSQERWIAFFTSLTDWPLSMWILSCCGYLAAAFCFVMRKAGRTNLETALLCGGGALFLLHFIMPFSGSSNSPAAPFRIELRFLIGPYLMGLFLLFRFMNSSSPIGKIWILLVCLAVLFRYGFRAEKILPAAAMILLCLGACPIWNRLRKQIAFLSRRPVYLSAVCFCLAAGMAVFYPSNQQLTDRRILGSAAESDPGADRAAVWRQLENLPPGGSIAGFGGIHPWYSYPFFGRRLQFEFVRINQDGTLRQPLYRRGSRRTGWFDWWNADSSSPVQETFLFNLQKSGVDYLILQADASDHWPMQRILLQNDPAAILEFENEYAQIWKVPRSF